MPYFKIPTLRPISWLPIQPFGVLVGIGLVVGYMLGRRRAAKTGLDPDLCADGMVWTVVGGFVLAHLVSVIFYFPEKIAKNPLVLLMFWAGLSSFGGFIGGALGAWYFFKRRNKVSLLAYADAIIFGLVPGWFFGRMGCTSVHDHPGKVTDFFLGVICRSEKCGAPWVMGQARHDLGLYEMIYTVFLTGTLYGFKNVRPYYGFHPALMLVLYSPVRFMLDYLRTADKLYWGFTPGQGFAIGMLMLAVALTINGLRLRKAGIAPNLEPLPSVPPEAEKDAKKVGKTQRKRKR